MKNKEMNDQEFKSGFISIIGRPNVGKSTFINRVIGQKIAIMSDKPQTTRNKVQGVLTTNNTQYIFIDTPGIHKPKHKLGDFMMKVAQNTLKEVDVILFMVNAEEGYGRGEEFILEKFQSVKTPIFLIINKIDRIHPDKLLTVIESYNEKYQFAEIIPISALEGNNIEQIVGGYAEVPSRRPAILSSGPSNRSSRKIYYHRANKREGFTVDEGRSSSFARSCFRKNGERSRTRI